MARTILLFHIISARPSKQPRMVRTFLKVYMELGSYFLFLQEQIKDIIIIIVLTQGATEAQRPAARPARSRLHACCTAQGAIRSGTRYAKWAGGSRSQTHRRAAKGGFTQDDVKVRRPRPDRTLLFLLLF